MIAMPNQPPSTTHLMQVSTHSLRKNICWNVAINDLPLIRVALETALHLIISHKELDLDTAPADFVTTIVTCVNARHADWNEWAADIFTEISRMKAHGLIPNHEEFCIAWQTVIDSIDSVLDANMHALNPNPYEHPKMHGDY